MGLISLVMPAKLKGQSNPSAMEMLVFYSVKLFENWMTENQSSD